jgi:hypothetical protein
MLGVQDLGFRVWGLGVRVWGLGLEILELDLYEECKVFKLWV